MRLQSFQLTDNIVPWAQANPKQKRISLFSPLGAALYGLAEGDETHCQLPLGEKRLKVIDVQPHLTSTSF